MCVHASHTHNSDRLNRGRSGLSSRVTEKELVIRTEAPSCSHGEKRVAIGFLEQQREIQSEHQDKLLQEVKDCQGKWVKSEQFVLAWQKKL